MYHGAKSRVQFWNFKFEVYVRSPGGNNPLDVDVWKGSSGDRVVI